MKQKLTATFGCLILSCALYAQNGWLPPVTFPANTYVCDNSPWKLIFYDEFNGNALSDKWLTGISYDSMYICRNGYSGPTREHLYHDEVRYSKDSKFLFMEENVVVSNGTCKLLMKYKPNSFFTVWDSTRCEYPQLSWNANLTAGLIRLPHQDLNTGGIKGYSSGKFQARLKIPGFEGAWTSFWMWFGRGGVDEIDITETFGGNGLEAHPVRFATVAWWLDAANNPNNLPQSTTIVKLYPRQSWTNWLLGTYLKKENWHTYTCEWDTASISFQLDGETPNKIWKYHQVKAYSKKKPNGYTDFFKALIGSGCSMPDSGVWRITKGYPWNSINANCDLRVSTGFTPRAYLDYRFEYGNTPHDLGQMEVDFVKIWQKHPEKDNHTELCADNTYPAAPVITGPNEVCGQVAYTISPATTGTWSTFDSDILAVGATTSSGASVAKDAGGAFNQGWVAFSYGNGQAGCPDKTVYKRGLYCNRSTDWNVMSPLVLNNNGEARVHFISELYYKRDVSGSTTPVVTWDVSINRGQDSYDEKTAEKYTLYGQYASTPALTAPGNGLFNIKWTMNVTDASGTWSRSGERNSKTALMQPETGALAQGYNSNTYYLNAYIDDQDYYDTTVYYSVASNMVSEEEYNDTLYMNEMIEKIRVVALEPYIITDGMESFMNKGAAGLDKPVDEGGLPALKSKLKVYPNPVRTNITIVADARFTDGQTITLYVYDLAGKLIKTDGLHYTKGNIMTYDLSDIADGNYILELQQGSINEHIKITKAKY